MNSIKNSTLILENPKINIKLKLSAIWITLMFLYIYKDILSLFRPGAIESILAGFMGPFSVTQVALLQATILMIIPAVMVLLSLTLKPNINRWTNVIVGSLFVLVNIATQIGETWVYYWLFGVVEIILTILIVWYAWKWPRYKNNYGQEDERKK